MRLSLYPHWSKTVFSDLDLKGAECAKPGMPPGLWTDDDLDTHEKRRAKTICHQCICVQRCFRYAMDHPELDGIWGATDEGERRKIRRRRVPETADKAVVSG